jgi:hypothetical protein
MVSGADTSPKSHLYKHLLFSLHTFSQDKGTKGHRKTHLIVEASMTMAIVNLVAYGVGVDDDDEVEE